MILTYLTNKLRIFENVLSSEKTIKVDPIEILFGILEKKNIRLDEKKVTKVTLTVSIYCYYSLNH